MKKSPLVVALPILAISALTLSGCGMFRSHKNWEAAKQEAPLEIPPGLDTPSTSAALVIPPPGENQPNANGATASNTAGASVITDGFVVADTTDNTYRRVGEALAKGQIGQLTAHDDASRSYVLKVVASAEAPAPKRGFFGRLFHRKPKVEETSGTYPVQLSIGASGESASDVRAQGNPAAVAKVIDALKPQLGG